ncbi:hypothetical protein M407DRAFT_226026 [Tulasnella calospora MUT 4182]|uniref:Uncharacterized protein n=1 Tax=Tulasnella calospora MUT 4182 TaxID=1051891 RepID=A0A0C3QF27_9AGAM|nr:hypothetical protein M407DRAFT_226026 [Tulasnella calospora MUT 4182]
MTSPFTPTRASSLSGNPFSNPEYSGNELDRTSPFTPSRASSLSGDPFANPEYRGSELDPPLLWHEEQLKPSMVVSFGISKKALVDDFKRWPELASELEQFNFKRYLGMVIFSDVFDPKHRWLSPQPPPEAPPESTQLYLIGSKPPSPEYFPNFIKEMYPSEASSLCRAISTSLQVEATTEEALPPYQIEGPPLRCRKLKTAYLYTSDTFKVRTRSVAPCESAEGTAGGWSIFHNGVSSLLDRHFQDAEDRVFRLRAEYKMQHNPEEPMPGRTLEGGKQLLDGIEERLRLAEYDVPVEVSLNIDVEEEIEDPCQFKKEVTAVRRTLYKYHEILKDFDPRAQIGGEMSDCASVVWESAWPDMPTEFEKVPDLPEHCPVMTPLMPNITGVPKPISREPDMSFLTGLATGLMMGLSAT